jgi:hypothetical protein
MPNSAKSMVSSRKPRLWKMEQRLAGLVPVQLKKVLAYFHGMFRRKFFGLKEDQQEYRWRVCVSISKYAHWSPLALPPVLSAANKDVGILILAYSIISVCSPLSSCY